MPRNVTATHPSGPDTSQKPALTDGSGACMLLLWSTGPYSESNFVLKRYSRHSFPERWGKLLSDVGSGTIVKLRVKERSQLGHNRHKPMECQLHALAQTDREIFQDDR